MQEVEDFVNGILKSEGAKELQSKEPLQNSLLDSFGYFILFSELDREYGCFDMEYVTNIDFDTYSIDNVVDRVIECKSIR